MGNNRKAEGLALNTIVIAAIALIVLLIIIGILMSTSGKVVPFFGKQADCTGRGGLCTKEADCGDVKVYGLKDCVENKEGKNVCCVKQV